MIRGGFRVSCRSGRMASGLTQSQDSRWHAQGGQYRGERRGPLTGWNGSWRIATARKSTSGGLGSFWRRARVAARRRSCAGPGFRPPHTQPGTNPAQPGRRELIAMGHLHLPCRRGDEVLRRVWDGDHAVQPWLEPGQAAHVVDQIGSPILVVARARPMLRTNRPILAFCSAKTCSIWAHRRLPGARP
jgi:hypothetical protein